jgi:hypothetical protein
MRTGRFIYKGEYYGFLVDRTNDYQKEYNNSLNYSIEFRIVWESDNEYDMIFMGGTKGCLSIGDTIKVKITSCSSKGYRYRSYCNKCGGNMKGELIKISNTTNN